MRTQQSHAASLTVSTTPHKRRAGVRTFFRTVAVLGLFMAVVPAQASAAACKTLLQDFVTYLKGPGTFVMFNHTTNYQANGYWATAHSWGFVNPATSGPILSGEMNREWHDDWTEVMSIELYADGSVLFGGQYGPYPTQCYGNKFLTVKTGDSFETFSFQKGGLF